MEVDGRNSLVSKADKWVGRVLFLDWMQIVVEKHSWEGLQVGRLGREAVRLVDLEFLNCGVLFGESTIVSSVGFVCCLSTWPEVRFI